MKYISLALPLIISLAFMGGGNYNACATERLIIDNLASLYESRRFDELVDYAQTLLETPESLYPEELIAVHSYLGFTYVILRQEQEAKYHFIQWLNLEPNAYLDPVLVPPNIIRVFQLAKDSMREKPVNVEYPSGKSDIWLQMRPALWRSLLLPGWGHYYHGKKTKGVVLSLGEAVLVGGFFICNNQYLQAREAYYHEDDFSKMNELYDDYNKWNKIRYSAAAAAVIFYMGIQYDLFNLNINSTSEEKSDFFDSSIGLTFIPSRHSIPSLRLTFSF